MIISWCSVQLNPLLLKFGQYLVKFPAKMVVNLYCCVLLHQRPTLYSVLLASKTTDSIKASH